MSSRILEVGDSYEITMTLRVEHVDFEWRGPRILSFMKKWVNPRMEVTRVSFHPGKKGSV